MDQPPKSNTLVAFLAAKGAFELEGNRVSFKKNEIANQIVIKLAEYVKRLLSLFVSIHFSNKFEIDHLYWGAKVGSETKVYFEFYLKGNGVKDEHVLLVQNIYRYILKNTLVEDDLFSKKFEEADVAGLDLEEIDQKIGEYLSSNTGSKKFSVSVGVEKSDSSLTIASGYAPFVKSEEFISEDRSFYGKLFSINFKNLEVSFCPELNNEVSSKVVICYGENHEILGRIINAHYPYENNKNVILYCTAETRKNGNKTQVYITDIQIKNEEDYKLT